MYNSFPVWVAIIKKPLRACKKQKAEMLSLYSMQFDTILLSLILLESFLAQIIVEIFGTDQKILDLESVELEMLVWQQVEEGF